LIRGVRADLVVGDIPPLACAAADRAGVPCLAIGNFTWIGSTASIPHSRESRGGDSGDPPRLRHATRALRLPLHGGFEPMADVTATSRSSRGNRRATRPRRGGGSGSPAIGRSCSHRSAPTAPTCRSMRCDGTGA